MGASRVRVDSRDTVDDINPAVPIVGNIPIIPIV